MAIFNYRRFKISLDPDSKKVQGLQTGDIVRRQYFDGEKTIYGLMCVLSYGLETLPRSKQGDQSSYFIGALLDGSEPKDGELLDFARVTNLFDTRRSGAIYMTADNDDAPYMDVVGDLAKRVSLCWPESAGLSENIDSKSQYVLNDSTLGTISYSDGDGERSRIGTITKNATAGTVGIKQDFYEFVQNPNRILISYKIKSSKNTKAIVTLGYSDGTKVDGTAEHNCGSQWEYKFYIITVDNSGRHLRSLRIEFPELAEGDTVSISDLNMIRLSDIVSFGESSQVRVGNLEGVVDPVFGQLTGYGTYSQNMFASRSAHISGTLTAGDKDGFGATFYAGKIHRNEFINSTEISFVGASGEDLDTLNPTGIGKIYKVRGISSMIAQTPEWIKSMKGKLYCISFWAYVKGVCQVVFKQNENIIGSLNYNDSKINSWVRLHFPFRVTEPADSNAPLVFSIDPTFENEGDPTSEISIAGPQLEEGFEPTQYQATDGVLDNTDAYGAWFSRGGIGGTMQNPLLKLNLDDKGSIGTRSNSFLLKTDGSGHLANGNIKWDETGKVTFGKDVTLNWDNLGEDTQSEISSKSIKIMGPQIFSFTKNISSGDIIYSPEMIVLTLQKENIPASASYQWFNFDGDKYVPIESANSDSYTVNPASIIWKGNSSLTIKCVASFSGKEYVDIVTISKQEISGYTLNLSSSNGDVFQNGICKTTLSAHVFYEGKPVIDEFVKANFKFLWRKYDLPDTEHEVENWWATSGVDRNAQSITLDENILGRSLFTCELQYESEFPAIPE